MPQPVFARALAVSLAALVFNPALMLAQNVAWDITPGTVGAGDGTITGGTGAWNTTNGNWTVDGGLVNRAWINANNDIAVFGGVAGTVTLSSGLTAGGLTFNTAGYILNSNTLTLAGGATVNVATGMEATINSGLSGTAGLTKSGAGTLLLNGVNGGLTGAITVSAGTLAVDGSQSNSRLANNAPVSIANGAVFEIRGVNALPSAPTNAVDFTVAEGGTLRVVAGGSTAIGSTGTSHAHVRNITLTGGTIELGYSGAGAAYDTESFQLDGNVLVDGSVPSRVIVTGGATGALQGIALNNGRTFTVNDVTGNDTVDFTVDAEIENTDGNNGALTKAGTGTMELVQRGTWTNGTTVNAGTLRLNTADGANSALGAGAVTVNTGGTLEAGLNAFGFTPASNNALTLAGGTLRQIGTESHLGQLTLNAGTITATDGSRQLHLHRDVVVQNNAAPSAFTVGQFNLTPTAGSVANAGSITFTVSNGAGATDFLVGGVLAGSGGVTKAGSGTLAITSASTYTGATNVNAGALLVSGSITGSAVTVNGGGTLGGTGGTLGMTVINSGGTLAPGVSIGTLTFASTLSLGGIALFEINKSGPTLSADHTVVASTLTLGGTLTVTATGDPLTQGDAFDLFDAATITGNFTTLNLPPLGSGLSWRTTDLGLNGTLTVIPEPGVTGLFGLALFAVGLRRRR